MSNPVKSGDETSGVPSVLIRDVPDDWHRRLRVAAAYRGESLSALGLRALKAEVERVESEMKAQDEPEPE